MRTYFVVLLALLVSVVIFHEAQGQIFHTQYGNGPYLAQGEVQVKYQGAGPAGYYTVSLPKEHSKDRTWPAIFCFHGKGGTPTVSPYRNFVDPEKFVLIGMDYFWDSMNLASRVDRDVENLKKLLPAIVKEYNLDTQYLYIAGNSAGGWFASGIFEAMPSVWAGAVILGSGRYEDIRPDSRLPSIGQASLFGNGIAVVNSKPDNSNFLSGKPVYIGAGEEDVNLSWAEKARDYYRKKNAEVDFEEYPGVGHGSYPATERLKQWFLNNGPMKQANAGTDTAQAAQQEGNLGEAYNWYTAVAHLPWQDQVIASALLQSGQLSERAEAQLNFVQQAVKEQRYQEALVALYQLRASFSGCRFGDQAKKQHVKTLQTGPEAQKQDSELRKLNAQALLLEKKAREAEKKKDYFVAFKLYDEYLASFQKADRCEIVRAHFEKLKADSTVQAAYSEQKREKECLEWLRTANELIGKGKKEEAKPVLQKVIDNYPDTKWANAAREKVKNL
jgi:predicted esterase